MNDEERYSFKVHLLRRMGWKPLLLLPALLFAGLWGFYLGGLYLFLLAILLLILTLRDFLFPLNYQLTRDGITMKGLFLKEKARWEEVEEIKREKGLLRLKLGKSSALRAARWFVIYLTKDEEEIWKRIESWRKNSSTE